MPSTLRDIAEALNLSVGTVSKVLNGRPDLRVPDETRRRIRDAALKLGYRPNAAARALQSGKTGLVALVLNRSTPLQGISEAVAERLGLRGYDLLVRVHPDQSGVLAGLDHLSRSRSCDAVVLWGKESDTEEQGALLHEQRMRFVVKGRHEERHPEWLQADFDHEGMMAEVVRHLAALGHRRIAYLGYDADAVFRHRLRAGFQDAMGERFGRSSPRDLVAEGGSSIEFNEACMERWLGLSDGERPTAVAIGSGNAAWEGVELALIRRGRRIGEGPGDLSAAGTSDGGVKLLFGNALAYQETELQRLARSLCDLLLIPCLAGSEVDRPVVRLLPELRPLPSRELSLRGPGIPD